MPRTVSYRATWFQTRSVFAEPFAPSVWHRNEVQLWPTAAAGEGVTQQQQQQQQQQPDAEGTPNPAAADSVAAGVAAWRSLLLLGPCSADAALLSYRDSVLDWTGSWRGDTALAASSVGAAPGFLSDWFATSSRRRTAPAPFSADARAPVRHWLRATTDSASSTGVPAPLAATVDSLRDGLAVLVGADTAPWLAQHFPNKDTSLELPLHGRRKAVARAPSLAAPAAVSTLVGYTALLTLREGLSSAVSALATAQFSRAGSGEDEDELPVEPQRSTIAASAVAAIGALTRSLRDDDNDLAVCANTAAAVNTSALTLDQLARALPPRLLQPGVLQTLAHNIAHMSAVVAQRLPGRPSTATVATAAAPCTGVVCSAPAFLAWVGEVAADGLSGTADDSARATAFAVAHCAVIEGPEGVAPLPRLAASTTTTATTTPATATVEQRSSELSDCEAARAALETLLASGADAVDGWTSRLAKISGDLPVSAAALRPRMASVAALFAKTPLGALAALLAHWRRRAAVRGHPAGGLVPALSAALMCPTTALTRGPGAVLRGVQWLALFLAAQTRARVAAEAAACLQIAAGLVEVEITSTSEADSAAAATAAVSVHSAPGVDSDASQGAALEDIALSFSNKQGYMNVKPAELAARMGPVTAAVLRDRSFLALAVAPAAVCALLAALARLNANAPEAVTVLDRALADANMTVNVAAAEFACASVTALADKLRGPIAPVGERAQAICAVADALRSIKLRLAEEGFACYDASSAHLTEQTPSVSAAVLNWAQETVLPVAAFDFEDDRDGDGDDPSPLDSDAALRTLVAPALDQLLHHTRSAMSAASDVFAAADGSAPATDAASVAVMVGVNVSARFTVRALAGRTAGIVRAQVHALVAALANSPLLPSVAAPREATPSGSASDGDAARRQVERYIALDTAAQEFLASNAGSKTAMLDLEAALAVPLQDRVKVNCADAAALQADLIGAVTTLLIKDLEGTFASQSHSQPQSQSPYSRDREQAASLARGSLVASGLSSLGGGSVFKMMDDDGNDDGDSGSADSEADSADEAVETTILTKDTKSKKAKSAPSVMVLEAADFPTLSVEAALCHAEAQRRARAALLLGSPLSVTSLRRKKYLAGERSAATTAATAEWLRSTLPKMTSTRARDDARRRELQLAQLKEPVKRTKLKTPVVAGLTRNFKRFRATPGVPSQVMWWRDLKLDHYTVADKRQAISAVVARPSPRDIHNARARVLLMNVYSVTVLSQLLESDVPADFVVSSAAKRQGGARMATAPVARKTMLPLMLSLAQWSSAGSTEASTQIAGAIAVLAKDSGDHETTALADSVLYQASNWLRTSLKPFLSLETKFYAAADIKKSFFSLKSHVSPLTQSTIDDLASLDARLMGPMTCTATAEVDTALDGFAFAKKVNQLYMLPEPAPRTPTNVPQQLLPSYFSSVIRQAPLDAMSALHMLYALASAAPDAAPPSLCSQLSGHLTMELDVSNVFYIYAIAARFVATVEQLASASTAQQQQQQQQPQQVQSQPNYAYGALQTVLDTTLAFVAEHLPLFRSALFAHLDVTACLSAAHVAEVERRARGPAVLMTSHVMPSVIPPREQFASVQLISYAEALASARQARMQRALELEQGRDDLYNTDLFVEGDEVPNQGRHFALDAHEYVAATKIPELPAAAEKLRKAHDRLDVLICPHAGPSHAFAPAVAGAASLAPLDPAHSYPHPDDDEELLNGPESRGHEAGDEDEDASFSGAAGRRHREEFFGQSQLDPDVIVPQWQFVSSDAPVLLIGGVQDSQLLSNSALTLYDPVTQRYTPIHARGLSQHISLVSAKLHLVFRKKRAEVIAVGGYLPHGSVAVLDVLTMSWTLRTAANVNFAPMESLTLSGSCVTSDSLILTFGFGANRLPVEFVYKLSLADLSWSGRAVVPPPGLIEEGFNLAVMMAEAVYDAESDCVYISCIDGHPVSTVVFRFDLLAWQLSLMFCNRQNFNVNPDDSDDDEERGDNNTLNAPDIDFSAARLVAENVLAAWMTEADDEDEDEDEDRASKLPPNLFARTRPCHYTPAARAVMAHLFSGSALMARVMCAGDEQVASEWSACCKLQRRPGPSPRTTPLVAVLQQNLPAFGHSPETVAAAAGFREDSAAPTHFAVMPLRADDGRDDSDALYNSGALYFNVSHHSEGDFDDHVISPDVQLLTLGWVVRSLNASRSRNHCLSSWQGGISSSVLRIMNVDGRRALVFVGGRLSQLASSGRTQREVKNFLPENILRCIDLQSGVGFHIRAQLHSTAARAWHTVIATDTFPAPDKWVLTTHLSADAGTVDAQTQAVAAQSLFNVHNFSFDAAEQIELFRAFRFSTTADPTGLCAAYQRPAATRSGRFLHMIGGLNDSNRPQMLVDVYDSWTGAWMSFVPCASTQSRRPGAAGVLPAALRTSGGRQEQLQRWLESAPQRLRNAGLMVSRSALPDGHKLALPHVESPDDAVMALDVAATMLQLGAGGFGGVDVRRDARWLDPGLGQSARYARATPCALSQTRVRSGAAELLVHRVLLAGAGPMFARGAHESPPAAYARLTRTDIDSIEAKSMMMERLPASDVASVRPAVLRSVIKSLYSGDVDTDALAPFVHGRFDWLADEAKNAMHALLERAPAALAQRGFFAGETVRAVQVPSGAPTLPWYSRHLTHSTAQYLTVQMYVESKMRDLLLESTLPERLQQPRLRPTIAVAIALPRLCEALRNASKLRGPSAALSHLIHSAARSSWENGVADQLKRAAASVPGAATFAVLRIPRGVLAESVSLDDLERLCTAIASSVVPAGSESAQRARFVDPFELLGAHDALQLPGALASSLDAMLVRSVNTDSAVATLAMAERLERPQLAARVALYCAAVFPVISHTRAFTELLSAPMRAAVMRSSLFMQQKSVTALTMALIKMLQQTHSA